MRHIYTQRAQRNIQPPNATINIEWEDTLKEAQCMWITINFNWDPSTEDEADQEVGALGGLDAIYVYIYKYELQSLLLCTMTFHLRGWLAQELVTWQLQTHLVINHHFFQCSWERNNKRNTVLGRFEVIRGREIYWSPLWCGLRYS